MELQMCEALETKPLEKRKRAHGLSNKSTPTDVDRWKGQKEVERSCGGLSRRKKEVEICGEELNNKG